MDNQFEVAKARNWKKEVDAEFEQVRILLKKVAEECEQKPYEDDTLLNAFHETGVKLTNTWDELSKQFKSLTAALENIANAWERALAQGVEAINSYKAKIGL